MQTPAGILLIAGSEQVPAQIPRLLESLGYPPHITSSGLDGIESALRIKPKLVLIATGLEDVDGVEVARRIKNRNKPPPLIVLIETEPVALREIDAGPGLAVDGLIAQPWTPHTLRHQLQAYLRLAEAVLPKHPAGDDRFQRFFRLSPEIYAISRFSDGVYIDVSDSFCSRLGFTRDEVIGHSSSELGLWADPTARDRLLQLIDEEGEVQGYELEMRTHSGAALTALLSGTPVTIGGEKHLLTLMTDITQRKQIEKALRESEEKFAKTFRLSPEIMSISRQSDGNFLDVNEAFERIVGWSRDEAIGKSSVELGIWADEQVRSEFFSPLLSQEQPGGRAVTLRRKNGEPFHVLLSSALISLNNEPAIISMATDISDRLAVEQFLARLAAAVEQAGEQIVILDADGSIRYVNKAVEDATGCSRSELLGLTPSTHGAEDPDGEYFQQIWEVSAQGESWKGHLPYRGQDGREAILDTYILPIRDLEDRCVGYVATRRDITQQLRMERHLRQSQKMEAIGTLAGGIAHDFNNLLFAILGNAEIARSILDECHPAVESLCNIETAAQRAKALVQRILTFSRKAESGAAPLELTGIVQEAADLLRATLPATIEMVLDLEPAHSCVIADPSEIHQMVVNLCTNAAQALPGLKGSIKISLRETRVGQELAARYPGLEPGLYKVLCVEDSGSGIPEEIRERIFEPFFTTREVGQGTGIGLSVIHGIVTRLGGIISVDSPQGRGAAFTVYLPAEALAMEQLAQVAPPRGRERILVVDDEPLLVTVMTKMLQGMGYEVTGCGSSRESLALVAADPGRFDLVVTDQTMPDLTGTELAREVVKVRENLPVIICSGYSQDVSPEIAAEMGIFEYLMKPIARADLAQAVRRALDSSLAAARG
jgi:PAS domain S-box-containing protein